MAEETGRGAHVDESEPDKQAPEEGAQPRGKWANNMEFILSMAGEIIGLGNVWRFPYLCYRNGGGAFLIPYFVFLIFCGIPVFFLETALGQYTSEGGVTAWRKICPMFHGVGFASQVIVIYLNIYYIVILAWVVFYLINSFKSPLPWSTCDNFWNTDSCHSRSGLFANPELFRNESNWSFLYNQTANDYSDSDVYLNYTSLHDTSSEEEFWRWRVLRMSDDMSLGKVHWDLALCLLLVWVICYFCIWKGIKTTGKVVYFTATFPYLMLFILFIRGVTLPGAADGLRYYLQPDFSKLGEANVWVDAGTQVFFSFAVCQGVLTALGSYNKYNNNCYRDCLALCCLNSATSIFAGFVVFSVLGFMAHDLNIPVSEISTSGPGLAFVVYPRALALLPGSSFWAVLFFFMLLLLGLDSQFVCVESLATAITDLFPNRLRRPYAREILVLVIAVVCFLFGLLFVTEGGIYLFQVVDNNGPSGTNLLIIALAETVIVAWIYGAFELLATSYTVITGSIVGLMRSCADRFYDNIEDMIGYAPLPLLKYSWLFITPLICGFTLLYKLVQVRTLRALGYEYGPWATAVGALLLAPPMLCIPLFIFISLCQYPNEMITPSKDLRQIRPHKPALTLCNCVILKGQRHPKRGVDNGAEKMMMEEPSRV